MGASCRITFEIDDGTFITPGPAGVAVTNNEYSNYLSTVKTAALTTVAFIGTGIIIALLSPVIATAASGGSIATVISLVALMLTNDE